MSRKHPDQDVWLELALAGRDLEAGNLARAAASVSNALLLAPVLPKPMSCSRGLPLIRAATAACSR